MAVFWMLAGLMTVLALAFVLVPLLRSRSPTGPSAAEANLEVLRGQRRELEADLATGVVAAESREHALAELVRRADADLAASDAAPVSSGKAPRWPAVLAALAIPAAAFGIYLAIGTPLATDPSMSSAGAKSSKSVSELVDKLAAKVRERPDDVKGWALLARSTAALGRFDESARAYERLVQLSPGDAQALADYADALGMSQGRKLAGRPYEIVRNALDLDPDNQKALALAATATMELGRFGESLAYWERLAGLLPPGSEDEKEVRDVIVEVRERAGMASTRVAAAPKAMPPTLRAPAASVSGVVTVAPEVAARIAPADTLFIFARAEGGPRAPLAVLRGTAGELPLRFALDDTMAMSPQWSLSRASEVRVEARVSRSGNAMPQSGDVSGTSSVVKPGATDVRIVLDKVLP